MRFRTTASSLALLVGFAASPGFADVTNAEVWSDWQDYMTGFGYEVSGTESASGNTLTVRNVTMSQTLPEDQGSVSLAMTELGFVQNNDGTVTVTLPQDTPVAFNVTPEDGRAFTGTLTLNQIGANLQVSGEANNLTYAYSADEVRLGAQNIALPNNSSASTAPDPTLSLDVILRNLNNTTISKSMPAERDYAQEATAASISYSLNFDIPSENGRAEYSGTMQDIAMSSKVIKPADTEDSDFAKQIAAGMTTQGSFSHNGGSGVYNSETLDGQKGTSKSDSGSMSFSVGQDGLNIVTEQAGFASELQVANLPFPVAVAMTRIGFTLGLPMSASEEPQDFTLGFTLGDLTISDGIWNMFDPGAQLPRDPATLALNFSGTARLLMDLFDADTSAAMERGTPPAEVNSLQVNELLLSVAGAELSGAGGFAFDNSDTTTFNGMPKPTGVLDLRLEGANALLDKLVQMGMLPQDQAMGARMMMGLFGTPQGGDVLTSKIEVNEEGHVLANGQRLQ